MDRRELLKAMALALGGSVALPSSVFAKMAETLDGSELSFFDETQRKLVAELAETIIPRTDTPGAIDAGVPAWIELLVQDCLPAADQEIIATGLAALEAACQAEFSKSFAALTTPERIALLTRMEKSAKAAGDSKAFIRQFKELTKFTFANSEKGATQAFEFVFVPGRWVPAMPLAPGQKAFAM